MSKLPTTQMVQPTNLVITSSLSQIVFMSSMAISQADRIPVFQAVGELATGLLLVRTGC